MKIFQIQKVKEVMNFSGIDKHENKVAESIQKYIYIYIFQMKLNMVQLRIH